MQRSVLVVAGREAPAQERSENVIAVLFVFREQPIFDQECNVAKSVANCWIIVDQVGRNIKDDFDSLKRNQFQSLAAIVVIGGDALDICLLHLARKAQTAFRNRKLS